MQEQSTANRHLKNALAKNILRAGIAALACIAFAVLGWRIASAAVTLASFDAQSSPTQIKLNWTTASERKNWGFNIERSTDKINWQHLGSNPSLRHLSPCIQNVMGASYQLTDTTAAPGVRYYYRLQMYGQPCGDPNNYSELVTSAMIGEPPATPTPTNLATPTLTTTPAQTATSIPTATPTTLGVLSPTSTLWSSQTIFPSRTPTGTPVPSGPIIPASTKVASVSTQSAASFANPQGAKGSTPIPQTPPIHEEIVPLKNPPDDVAPVDAPPETPGTPHLGARDWVRIGFFGAAGVLALAAMICGAGAFYYFLLRPKFRQ